ncbi:MAG: bifunctional diguanylate cyclase/phosphodiesterase [Ilumatobacter fluminis]|uniref:putative bifunctional diguanylate cyclase/phosphodiesterase n=1 Tax=Ilumatobacter fluminis TaxID=467091 RepID=UPI0032EE8BD7
MSLDGDHNRTNGTSFDLFALELVADEARGVKRRRGHTGPTPLEHSSPPDVGSVAFTTTLHALRHGGDMFASPQAAHWLEPAHADPTEVATLVRWFGREPLDRLVGQIVSSGRGVVTCRVAGRDEHVGLEASAVSVGGAELVVIHVSWPDPDDPLDASADGSGDRRLVDPLTGLCSRDVLQSTLTRLLDARRCAAVLFADLDHFKRINDTRGHHVGDMLLVEFGNRLRDAAGSEAVVCRFGGDEFVVVVPDATESGAAASIERIVDAAAVPFDVGDVSIQMSISIGVGWAHPSDPGNSRYRAERVVQEADTALIAAKHRGRRRVVTFSEEMRKRMVEQVEVETALRSAIRTDEIRLRYQPHVDMATGKIVGVEALSRWVRPDGSTVSPTVFIPAAEESGLIVELGRRVLHEACIQLAVWQRTAAYPPAMVSVNVSPLQLSHSSLVDDVKQAIAEAGIRPESLCLEITESGYDDLRDELDVIHALRDVGCYLAIDDFGAGYSSLSRVRHLPVEVMKIDRSFVDGLGTETEDSAIVAAIMSLSLTMGLHVIAEGVERPEQATGLLDLGCQVAQGYLFSEALDPADLAVLLERPSCWTHPDSHAGAPVLDPASPGRTQGHRLLIHEFLDQIGVPVGEMASS